MVGWTERSQPRTYFFNHYFFAYLSGSWTVLGRPVLSEPTHQRSISTTGLTTSTKDSNKQVLLLRVSSPALGRLTAAWVRYCMTNFTGSTSPTGCFSSWQWQFTGVWMAAHRRTCRTTALRPPVSTLCSTCVPPTVNCLHYLATGSTLTAVGPFRLPVPQSGTFSRISSETRPSVHTFSDVCLKLPVRSILVHLAR